MQYKGEPLKKMDARLHSSQEDSEKCTDQQVSFVVKSFQSQLVPHLQHLVPQPEIPPWCQKLPLGLHYPQLQLSACSKHSCKMSQFNWVQHGAAHRVYGTSDKMDTL